MQIYQSVSLCSLCIARPPFSTDLDQIWHAASWWPWGFFSEGRPHDANKHSGWSVSNCYLCIHFLYFHLMLLFFVPSVLWHCWLGARKDIRPVKTEWWGAGVVICLEWDADLHMAQLMPLALTVSCFSKIQIGFIFLVLAHPGGPRQRAVKRACVCDVVVFVLGMYLLMQRMYEQRKKKIKPESKKSKKLS